MTSTKPKLIPLSVWADEMFGEHAPHRHTLRNWVNSGKIRPVPIKVGQFLGSKVVAHKNGWIDNMDTKSDLFLTTEEVAELTGVRNGRRGKSREELQVAWLRTSGIPFWVNARGRPIIARARITGQPTEPPPRPKWQPAVLRASTDGDGSDC